MKKCIHCARDIEQEALRCGYCGKHQDESDAKPADGLPKHFRTSFIIIALCCAGPLALPLIWMRPRTALFWKIFHTLLVLLITALLCWVLFLAILKLIEVVHECYALMEDA